MTHRPFLTKHARQRSRERMGLKRGAAERMAGRAYDNGLSPEHTRGTLKDYMDHLAHRYRIVAEIRIYADRVFIFESRKLVTVYALPREYQRLVAKALRQRKSVGTEDSSAG